MSPARFALEICFYILYWIYSLPDLPGPPGAGWILKWIVKYSKADEGKLEWFER